MLFILILLRLVLYATIWYFCQCERLLL